MQPIETIKLDGGYVLKIYPDDDAEAPQNKDSEADIFLACPSNRHFNPYIPKDAGGGFGDIDREKYEEFPLYAYIHGGIALSVSRTGQFACQWDSGRIGSVFVAKSANWKSADEIASDWVEYWNGYLSGERYGYVLESPDGDDLDSCWGFDDLEYMKSEALAAHVYRMEQDAKTEKMLTL